MSNPHSICVRDAEVRDVGAIHGLIGELADYEKLGHEFVGGAATLSEHLFGEQRYAWALVAEEEGSVIGFALYFFNYSTFLCKPGIYLEDLYVQLAHRRRGVGLRLLTTLAQRAVARGCGRLEWAVLDWNQPAIRFYDRIGAEAKREWLIRRLSGEPLAELAKG